MTSLRILTLILTLALSSGLAAATDTAHASDPNALVDAATRQRLDKKADRIVAAFKLDDAARSARVNDIVRQWLITLHAWHQQHDATLANLWSQWSRARAVVPKDEFPAEVIAHQIDAVYASLKPACQKFLEQLAAELSPEQIDAFKESWSRSPGRKRTYDAFLEIVPDLTEQQKKVIHDRMLLAREDALLTDSDREIVNIFKRHKVKVEAYVGTLQWAKLHSAFANRGKKT